MPLVPLIQPVWAHDPSEVPYERSASYGLFIGVRHFGDGAGQGRPSEIPYAVDDAIDLAWLFVHELGLLEAERVRLMLAGDPHKASSADHLARLLAGKATVEPPTYTRVHVAIENLMNKHTTSAPGLLVVSFATHGVYLANADGDRLLCADSARELLHLTTISVNRLVTRIASAKAGRRLALIDSCRKRPYDEADRSVDDDVREAAAQSQLLRQALSSATGTAVLSATSVGGLSFDDAERHNGVFTSRLIEGLRGAAPADGKRGYITVRSLADWTNEQVRQWLQRNQKGNVHDSAGIGREFSGINPEEIPLAISVSAMQRKARQRRREVYALFATLRAKHEVFEEVHAEMTQTFNGEPMLVGEKPATDQVERQLKHVSATGDVAAENFVLWWRTVGRRLLLVAPAVEAPEVAEQKLEKPKLETAVETQQLETQTVETKTDAREGQPQEIAVQQAETQTGSTPTAWWRRARSGFVAAGAAALLLALIVALASQEESNNDAPIPTIIDRKKVVSPASPMRCSPELSAECLALANLGSIGKPPMPQATKVMATTRPTGVAVTVNAGDRPLGCSPTPCQVSIDVEGPFEVVLEKQRFKTRHRHAADLDELRRVLRNVVLVAE